MWYTIRTPFESTDPSVATTDSPRQSVTVTAGALTHGFFVSHISPEVRIRLPVDRDSPG